MAKRFYKKRRAPKRRFVRRRRYRARSRMGTPDGPVKEKVTIRFPVVLSTPAQAQDQTVTINIRWHNQTPNGVPLATGEQFSVDQNVVYITNNDQFAQMARIYSFYKVYGMGMKFMPEYTSPVITEGPRIRDIEIATIRSTYPTQNQQPDASFLRQAKDYKIYSGHRMNVRRFYRIGKYHKGIKVDWLPIEGELAPADQMRTCMRLNVNNFPAAGVIGTLYVTYYLAYKNRSLFPVDDPPQEDTKSLTKSQVMDIVESRLKI